MTHEDLLNLIFSHQYHDDDAVFVEIELHDMLFQIRAKRMPSKNEKGEHEYELLSVTRTEWDSDKSVIEFEKPVFNSFKGE